MVVAAIRAQSSIHFSFLSDVLNASDEGGKGADPGRRKGAALMKQYFPTSSHNARPEAVST